MKYFWFLCVMIVICIFSTIVISNKRSESQNPRIAFENLKYSLGFHERTVYSQNGEDGVIFFLQGYGLLSQENGYYVEFGTEDAMERNTRAVMESSNYTGLLMDGAYENPDINLRKEWITSHNINSLFQKYNVPLIFDILSIDLDSFDYWVWKNISSRYKPNLIITEINSFFPPPIAITQKDVFHNPSTHDVHFGMSLQAAFRLARSKGYSLFYIEEMGVNAFWLRDDLIQKLLSDNWPINNIELIYTSCGYGSGQRNLVNGIDVGKCHSLDNERVHKYGPWVNVITGEDWLPNLVPGNVQKLTFP